MYFRYYIKYLWIRTTWMDVDDEENEWLIIVITRNWWISRYSPDFALMMGYVLIHNFKKWGFIKKKSEEIHNWTTQLECNNFVMNLQKLFVGRSLRNLYSRICPNWINRENFWHYNLVYFAICVKVWGSVHKGQLSTSCYSHS